MQFRESHFNSDQTGNKNDKVNYYWYYVTSIWFPLKFIQSFTIFTEMNCNPERFTCLTVSFDAKALAFIINPSKRIIKLLLMDKLKVFYHIKFDLNNKYASKC